MNRRSLVKAAGIAATSLPVMMTARPAAAQSLGPLHAVINHPVKDYVAWRAVYDSAEPVRKQAGFTGAEVFRDPKDPNLIVVIHRFPSVEAAQGFFGKPELKEAMTKAGVAAPPTITLAVAA